MNKKSSVRIKFILIFMFSIIFVCVCHNAGAVQNTDKKNNIEIAFISTISGEDAYHTETALNAIKMYTEKVNLEGGINGKKIDILVFDDEFSEKTAIEKANEIAYKTDALIVIGHRTSAMSIPAGEVYKKAEIPVISGSATADKLTKDNPFYFRVVANNSQQAEILAYYSKNILNYSDMYIVYDEDDYGLNLCEAFEKTAQKLNIQINRKWSLNHEWNFSHRQEDLDKRIKNIVKDMSELQDKPEAIFLAIHDAEALPLIKYMKDYHLDIPLICSEAVGMVSFGGNFKKFPLEQKSPGFYTDGIYASTDFISDVANENAKQFTQKFRKKYNRTPGSEAISNYDAVGIAIEAIRKADISGRNIQEDRKKIRDYLASVNRVENAFNGLSGHIFFDSVGNALRSITMGTFYNQKLISAPIQLNPIAELSTIISLKKNRKKSEDIVKIGDTYLQITKVVYTGSDIIEIKDLDFENSTCFLDFHLWFRFHGELDTENFEFVNAVEPIKIENLIHEKKTAQAIYRLYRVKGRFKMDFLPYGTAEENKHIIGFSFYHKELPRERLIIVHDAAYMGDTDEDIPVTKIKDAQVLSNNSNWSVNNVSFFQDTIKKSTLGDPDSLNIKKAEMEFSRLTTRIDIKKHAITLRGVMPLISAIIVSLMSALILLASPFVKKKDFYNNFSKTTYFVQSLAGILLIIGLETVIIKSFAGTMDRYFLNLITQIFNILWWLTCAAIFVQALNHFMWIPLEKRIKRNIPSFLRRAVALIIYTLAIFGVIAFVFDQKITSLLATSGMFAMIIGLAVQMNLSNVFSGLAINVELPFRVNDWVKIGSFDEGKVIDITWRTTRIQTREASILSIPNSIASEASILNYCYPDNKYFISFKVHVDPAHPFEHVQKIILESIHSGEGVLKEPAPVASFTGFTDWSAAYFIGFYVDDYLKKPFYTSSVWKEIYKHFKREGITPVTQFRQYA